MKSAERKANVAVEKEVVKRTILGEKGMHQTGMRGVNWFEGTYRTIVNDIEYEANLFAVALLFDENDFNTPLEDMSNYALKSVLDYNLRKWQ